MASVGQCLRRAAAALAGPEARWEAEMLLAHALRCERSWLYSHADAVPDAATIATFDALLAQRREGTPLAYVIGRRSFWRFELAVDRSTLIPRPDTELLVELALERIPVDAPCAVLDLGTGSGAVALAIAMDRPRSNVTAVDASEAALVVARANAQTHALGNVEMLHSDWFSALADRRFDVVVGNPPYLAEDDPHLHSGELQREPRTALVSGVDGLDAIRRIAVDAINATNAGGCLLLEHGWTQGEAARAILADAGWQAVATKRDLEGRDRVTLGQR
ncbi:MAG: peptide chain release factor N(5)-glutamine methyltransferase [Arenimonas sp.]